MNIYLYTKDSIPIVYIIVRTPIDRILPLNIRFKGGTNDE